MKKSTNIINSLRVRIYGNSCGIFADLFTNRLPTCVLLLVLSSPLSWAHMRGPHHPRSPIASSQSSSSTGETHHHYVPQRPPASDDSAPILTHDKNLLHDKEHLKEDMGDWILEDGKEMSPEEMEFHYFKMHDFDNNSMLDGLEILQAISHILPEPNGDAVDLTINNEISKVTNKEEIRPKRSEEDIQKQKEDDFNYYIDLIDKVLEEDDMNKDGYLSYFEYVVGRRRDDRKENAPAKVKMSHSG